MKQINNILIIASLLLSLFTDNYLLILGFIPLLSVSLIIRKYNKNLEFVYLIFLFFSYILGFTFDFYNRFYYYDAIVHSMFGLIASIYALPLLNILKHYNKKNKLFNTIFIIILTLSLAGFWEIIEFTMDKLFNTNMQLTLNNTMKDIISAFLFSILYVIIYLDKQDIITKLFINKN